MSAAVRNGLIVAAVHVAMVSALGGKLLVDRATQPRVWARAAPFDPNLPIRGRYVRLQIEAGPGEGLTLLPESQPARVALAVRDDRLIALPADDSNGLYARGLTRDGAQVAVLEQPVAYFIPEHVPDPSIRPAGEELWVEVTVPARGAPRPIRLGVRKDGVLTPLQFD